MELIEGGIIVNTHGVHGAVKIEPWTDTPEFLCGLPRLFTGGTERAVLRSSVHKNHVLATLEGIETTQEAASLRGTTVSFEKSDAMLPEGAYFVADLLGLEAVDDETGVRFGVIGDFLAMPASGVYVVTPDSERGEMLIPAVPEFVRKIDPAGGFVRFRLMEGL
ncbi:MAG: 16S rRNA processing protein RimM [Clostridiales bacterium]|nr:16S rRNA processing protein RimM [Clostridiales bacterium]